ATELEHELSALETALTQLPAIEKQPFSAAISSIRNAADLLVSKTRAKSQHPTQGIEVTDVKQLTDELDTLVNAKNKEIEEHNQLIANSAIEHDKLVDDGWSLFLGESSVRRELKQFIGIS